jgi:hypothetical protein
MTDKPTPPALNTLDIPCPTDRITWGQMRKVNKEKYPGIDMRTYHKFLRVQATDIDAIGLHAFEVLLAEKAFAKATGQPEEPTTLSREELVQCLIDGYGEYGLSPGPVQSRQMIREIEAAAIRQAGKGPAQKR